MNGYEMAMHYQAGRAYGIERTCGTKVDYKTEERANKSAMAMNKKSMSNHELEAYPCAWCYGWHIGRKMTEAERDKYSKSQ